MYPKGFDFFYRNKIAYLYSFSQFRSMEIPRLKLKPKTKAILAEWLFIIVIVNLMMFGYFIVGWWGMRPYLAPLVFTEYLDSYYIYLEIFIQGTIFGVFFGLINYISDNTSMKKLSFGTLILVKGILYFIAILVSQLAVYGIYVLFSVDYLDSVIGGGEIVSFRFVFSLFTYFIFIVLFLNFLLHINRKLGPMTLFYLISGKYYRPREERRIFMFLDMKDSTGTAEQLGNIKYSLLIKECIHIVSDLVIRYRAEIYQYVGDEVVLTWPTKRGIKQNNFLNIYFAFSQALKDKEDYFMKRFNTVPTFKAGIDEGFVTVTEVGDIKRELAYHGDVLHTAARLEKLCNKLESKVLITQNLENQIQSGLGFRIQSFGEYLLKGKGKKETVFGISRI